MLVGWAKGCVREEGSISLGKLVSRPKGYWRRFDDNVWCLGVLASGKLGCGVCGSVGG